MDTISEIIKSINSQNEALKIGSGLNYLQGIAGAIGRQHKNQFDLGGLKNITDIARSISQKTQPINFASMTMGSVIQTMALPNYKKYDPLYGLTTSLAAVARTSPLASNNLSSFAVSRLSVVSNLSEIAKVLNQPYLREFNPLNAVIKNISNSYIQSVAVSRRWEDISVAEEANDTIANITEELINSTPQVTLQDLENLKQSIVNELYELHRKTNTEKARQFIVELISIISFLLTFYSVYKSETDISNKDVLLETKKEITKINTEISRKIEFELNKLNKTRIARKNVYLKYSCKKRCKTIGLVKAGQQVTVIEIRNKYLLISYIDFETSEPKSGYVTKKYFDIE